MPGSIVTRKLTVEGLPWPPPKSPPIQLVEDLNGFLRAAEFNPDSELQRVPAGPVPGENVAGPV